MCDILAKGLSGVKGRTPELDGLWRRREGRLIREYAESKVTRYSAPCLLKRRYNRFVDFTGRAH